MTAPDHRAELVADLRAFADLLERRPDMPVQEFTDATTYVHVSSAAEVHRLAAILGVEVVEDPGRARAQLDVGRVRYVVSYNSERVMAEWEAVQSYRGAVVPDMVGAS